MVKFKWSINKIAGQRIIIIGMIGAISCGILNGYMKYYQQVSEYLQSMEYRQAQEATKDYHVKLMKTNRQRSPSENPESPKT